MTSADPFEARFAELKTRFRERLRLRLRNLRALEGEDAALPELRAIAHDIAGSAGSFGYPALSDLAFTLEAAAERGEREGARAALRALAEGIEAEVGGD